MATASKSMGLIAGTLSSITAITTFLFLSYINNTDAVKDEIDTRSIRKNTKLKKSKIASISLQKSKLRTSKATPIMTKSKINQLSKQICHTLHMEPMHQYHQYRSKEKSKQMIIENQSPTQ